VSSPAMHQASALGNEKIVVEESDGERITGTGYRALRRLSCVIQRDRTQRKHREQSAIRPAANAVVSRVLLSPAATGWSTSRLEPLSGAAAKAVPTVPSGGRGCFSALASILQLLFTTIAARARPFSDRV
jgi:hypothetical protein